MKTIFYSFFTLTSMCLFAQVGVETTTPTETFHVEGTTRLSDLPTNGTPNAINTIPGTGEASGAKDQTFTANRTLVVDQNGVLGTVDGVAITAKPKVKTIAYAAKTTKINSLAPIKSVVEVGNLRVRFNGTEPNGGEASLSFKLINNITDQNGNLVDGDNVIVNAIKIGSGITRPNSAQQTYFSASKNVNDNDGWYEITKSNARPNVRNNDFVIINISLINTKENYRVTAIVNGPIDAKIHSDAEVTLFIERLSDIDINP